MLKNLWIVRRVTCLFKGHVYKHVIGSQYMCDRCYKVEWERKIKKK